MHYEIFRRLSVLPLIAILIAACSRQASYDDSQLTAAVDRAIDSTAIYDAYKLARIDSIKRLTGNSCTTARRVDINRQLFREYEALDCDSALRYINDNIAIGRRESDSRLFAESSIYKAQVVARAGLFVESMDLLRSISPDSIPADLLDEYYLAKHDLYQFMVEFVEGTDYAGMYTSVARRLADSIMAHVDDGSFVDDITITASLAEDGKLDEAEKIAIARIPKYRPGTREYSVMTSIMAHISLLQGDHAKRKKYLALSAISDIRGSVKENMAMRSLAEELYDGHDIEHASRYIQKSIEDANYYSARMRKSQSTRMLPLVESSYRMDQLEARSRLKLYLIIISIMAAGLIISVIYIVRHLRIVSRSHKTVSQARDELSRLNAEMASANSQLERANSALSESNAIKEVYINRFLHLCSKYISTLDHYRKDLHRKAAAGNIDDLYRTLRSTAIVDSTLKEFYKAFDQAFLTIFPDFVDRLNALLQPDGQVSLGRDEKLNTELRVFALIRIGIADSNMIAEFLRCSLSTIYTYRSRMKSRAIDPATFEEKLMEISS